VSWAEFRPDSDRFLSSIFFKKQKKSTIFWNLDFSLPQLPLRPARQLERSDREESGFAGNRSARSKAKAERAP
jgi:hypothetical protein